MGKSVAPAAHVSGRVGALPALLLTVLFAVLGLIQFLYFPARQKSILGDALRSKGIAMTELVAESIAAGLEFEDGNLIRDSFTGAARDADLVYIAVFREDGHPFQSWRRDEKIALDWPRSEVSKTMVQWLPGRLQVMTPVNASGGTQGVLVAGFTDDKILKESRRNQTVAAAIGVMLCALGLLVALAITWQIGRIRKLTSETQIAEAASKAKGLLLANVSHEIRTPLNGVLGMAALLLTTPLTSKQHHLTSAIRRSGNALLALINDLLDLSKIEAGKLAIEKASFDLHELVTQLVQDMGQNAFEKGLELLVDVANDVPQVVRGDALRVRQVLTNLIGNAVKFTQSGEVTVTAALEKGRNDLARFSVRDTGIGISKEDKGRLFQAFEQADVSTTRRHGGTGLGLSISKHLVELMGGDISLESEPRQGSVFSFTLPIDRHGDPDDGISPELLGKRLLLVQAHARGRAMLAARLRQAGLLVDDVATPEGALALLSSLEAGERLDFVVIDVAGHRDLELHRMRRSPACFAARLVLLTSIAEGGRANDVREPGTSTVIKPIWAKELCRQLCEVPAGASSSRLGVALPVPAEEPGQEGDDARPLVLVVDDSPTNREVLCGMLDVLGYRFETAENGRQAFELLRQDSSYSAVLMDVEMPEMDGHAATAAIRAVEEETGRARICIIAVTARTLEGEREKALRAGMDDYLSKPIELQQLQIVLRRRRLFEGQSRASDQRQLRPFPSSISALAAPPSLDPRVVQNLQKLQTPKRPDFCARLVRQYHADSAEVVGAMKAACERHESESLRAVAHRFKGSSRMIGALRLGFLCEQVETTAKADDFAAARVRIDELEQELSRVTAALSMLEPGGSPPKTAGAVGDAF